MPRFLKNLSTFKNVNLLKGVSHIRIHKPCSNQQADVKKLMINEVELENNLRGSFHGLHSDKTAKLKILPKNFYLN